MRVRRDFVEYQWGNLKRNEKIEKLKLILLGFINCLQT